MSRERRAIPVSPHSWLTAAVLRPANLEERVNRMKLTFPVCVSENREIDGFDFIAILGLMKEYNLKEIWRRYLPIESPTTDTISLYLRADRYFLEMHVQKMRRIILSEKFNTNPFFMQQVIQRITASHDHDLIMSKIRNQGVDTGDNPISLSCSLGNTIIDLIVNKNDPFPGTVEHSRGRTTIEETERRPLDIYDLSSILYLCQQNLTESIFRRYLGSHGGPGEQPTAVGVRTNLGDYAATLRFTVVPTDREMVIPPPGNVSVSTIHQVIQRMNFGHSAQLILNELSAVGLSIGLEQLMDTFTLRRYINNTFLVLELTRMH